MHLDDSGGSIFTSTYFTQLADGTWTFHPFQFTCEFCQRTDCDRVTYMETLQDILEEYLQYEGDLLYGNTIHKGNICADVFQEQIMGVWAPATVNTTPAVLRPLSGNIFLHHREWQTSAIMSNRCLMLVT